MIFAAIFILCKWENFDGASNTYFPHCVEWLFNGRVSATATATAAPTSLTPAAQNKCWWQLKGDGDGRARSRTSFNRHHSSSSSISRWWQSFGLNPLSAGLKFYFRVQLSGLGIRTYRLPVRSVAGADHDIITGHGNLDLPHLQIHGGILCIHQ